MMKGDIGKLEEDVGEQLGRADSGKDIEDMLLKEGTFDILLMLNEGPKSFIELRRGGHSPNTVLIRLRGLQRDGLVQSKLSGAEKGRRPRIKYILTDQGQKFVRRYVPVTADYLELKTNIENLENRIQEQKQAIKLLLSSVNLRK